MSKLSELVDSLKANTEKNQNKEIGGRDLRDYGNQSPENLNCAIANSLNRYDGKGDTKRLEDSVSEIVNNPQAAQHLLASQILLTNSLFVRLVNVAHNFLINGKIDEEERLFDLANMAQNNSRRSIKTLSEIQNPKKTTFVKNQLNQLNLENSNDAQMDGRSQTETARLDAQTQTLVEIDRANIKEGNGDRIPECQEVSTRTSTCRSKKGTTKSKH
ncbi:MAG: hypothetical protein VKK42_25830 [Lyngbya sp.]|nr:hypothetical protein [Lyngbya sp.]